MYEPNVAKIIWHFIGKVGRTASMYLCIFDIGLPHFQTLYLVKGFLGFWVFPIQKVVPDRANFVQVLKCWGVQGAIHL